MIGEIVNLWPVILALIIYFVRLETRFAKIVTDLCWIKKELKKCQPNLGNDSP